MTTFGYARVSDSKQSLDIQIADLNAHACEVIRSEKVSGSSVDNRPELRLLLDFVRKGDTLFVTRLDRLARSMVDFCNIVAELEAKGVTLIVTQQAIDTSTSTGRLLINMLGAFAQFELEIRRERMLAGIEKAKAAGKYTGRKHSFPPAEIRRQAAITGLKGVALAKKLQCSRATIKRALAGLKQAKEAAE